MKHEIEAEYMEARKEAINAHKYHRWELGIGRAEGEIEGEIFIHRDICPPKGTRLKVTIETID